MIRDQNGDLHDRADPARWPRARPVPLVLPESMAMPPLVVIVLLVSRTVAGHGVGALRREVRPVTLAVGLGVFGAYGLTLTALALVSAAQVPAVAAVRESSILFVLALTRPSLVTAMGGALVFGGVVLLAVMGGAGPPRRLPGPRPGRAARRG